MLRFGPRKSDFSQGGFLHFLTQPKITRQRPFEITDIEYDVINDSIETMERVEYNTSGGWNVLNFHDIEDLENFYWLWYEIFKKNVNKP